MKKSLLALAVISAATMASAEVKLSGDITVGLTSTNGSRAQFSEAGSELNIDASQDIGGGNTAYAHVELEFDGHNKTGGIKVDEGRVGLKGSWGQVELGDTKSGCDHTDVGGVTSDQQIGYHGKAGCGPNGGGKEGISYVNKFGPVKAALSYHPGALPGRDQVSLGVNGAFGPVKASLGYTDHSSNGPETFLLGLEGKFGDFSAGAQYQNTDNAGVDTDAWELGVNYSLASGDIYAGYGETETGGADTDGWMIGYKHNISDRTWTWIEIGEEEGHSDTSWSTGLAHKF